jgi:ferric-dicitrate binding protein FerR (iron transport regulator)
MEEELLLRYLQNRLTKEEKSQLREWLAGDPEHGRLLSIYKKCWSLSYPDLPLSDSETEKEINIFQERFLQSDKKRRIIPRGIRKVLQYAAVFAAAFGLSFLLFKSLYRGPEIQNAFNEIITTPGEKSQVVLADGSKIWVNACTKLRYPVNLRAEEVELYLEGEAYFDLKKIPGRHITVHTSQLNIKVIGTAFNLKSYSDEDVIEATLVRGKIAIEDASGKGNEKQILLAPNQSAVYFKKSGRIEASSLSEHRIKNAETIEGLEQLAKKNQSNIIVEEAVDIQPQISWIEGKMVFRKETFETLANRLERRYNVKINIKDDRLRKTRFSGTFEKESIEQVMHALSYPVPFKYTIIKDSIVIESKNNIIHEK